jgi:hypothetical protein
MVMDLYKETDGKRRICDLSIIGYYRMIAQLAISQIPRLI